MPSSQFPAQLAISNIGMARPLANGNEASIEEHAFHANLGKREESESDHAIQSALDRPFASVHFSSCKEDWETPQSLFDPLSVEFGGFDLDAAASDSNHLCPRYFTKEREDGLKISWAGYRKVWLNPPYSTEIGDWLEKAWESTTFGVLTVALVPSRTDTRWWHHFVNGRASEVRFIKGRLRFSKHKHCAPFPSAILVYLPREDENEFPETTYRHVTLQAR